MTTEPKPGAGDDEKPATFVPTPVPTPEPTPGPRIPSKTPLYEAMNAARYARQALIKEIEQLTKTSLICYVSPNSEIERDDVIAMVDLLHNTVPGAPVDLMLHSQGGDIDAAEKLITLIRKRAGTAPVRVIVPDYAKSAATLVALGADAILMSDSSELGAIDPQVALPNGKGHLQTISAQGYLDAFNNWAKMLREDPTDPVARLMLDKMEPSTIHRLEQATTRSRKIAAALLGTAMIKDEADASAIVDDLSDTRKWHSHGQMIPQEALLKLGLSVKYLAPHDPQWQLYWRLFCLQITAANGSIKLFEGSYASLALP